MDASFVCRRRFAAASVVENLVGGQQRRREVADLLADLRPGRSELASGSVT
jgi:hypothetical protein